MTASTLPLVLTLLSLSFKITYVAAYYDPDTIVYQNQALSSAAIAAIVIGMYHLELPSYRHVASKPTSESYVYFQRCCSGDCAMCNPRVLLYENV